MIRIVKNTDTLYGQNTEILVWTLAAFISTVRLQEVSTAGGIMALNVHRIRYEEIKRGLPASSLPSYFDYLRVVPLLRMRQQAGFRDHQIAYVSFISTFEIINTVLTNFTRTLLQNVHTKFVFF
jgi:hypothetical protein